MARIEGTNSPQRTTAPAANDVSSTRPRARPEREPLFTRLSGETPKASAETVRGSRKMAQMNIQEEMRLLREQMNSDGPCKIAPGSWADRMTSPTSAGGAAATEAAAPGFAYPEGFPKVSADQLRRIMPAASEANVQKYLEPLNQAMAQHEINTPARQQAFLAQVAHESAQLNYSEEIASGRAYEGRRDLGNTQPGDGVRFKGRGLIQLTGRANYAEMSERFGRDLVGNPEQVANDPVLSARVAAHFFQSRGLNELADSRDFLAVTRRINGGTNGLRDRQEFYATAREVIS